MGWRRRRRRWRRRRSTKLRRLGLRFRLVLVVIRLRRLMRRRSSLNLVGRVGRGGCSRRCRARICCRGSSRYFPDPCLPPSLRLSVDTRDLEPSASSTDVSGQTRFRYCATFDLENEAKSARREREQEERTRPTFVCRHEVQASRCFTLTRSVGSGAEESAPAAAAAGGGGGGGGGIMGLTSVVLRPRALLSYLSLPLCALLQSEDREHRKPTSFNPLGETSTFPPSFLPSCFLPPSRSKHPTSQLVNSPTWSFAYLIRVRDSWLLPRGIDDEKGK
ncbi:hypothetical protein BDY24DRAFT_383578 [Mrakia frigida]|uniref:uncharacterized protein n=1 Tax=Mrakia frigida TaxID=29902 RepID=UPI003FCC195A